MNDEIKRRIEHYKKHENDACFLQELEDVLTQGDEKEILDRFYTTLEFGTGGIRGIVGAGSNRLNSLVVRTIATGWAQYLHERHGKSKISVVIAYDSRNFSDIFSRIVSETLIGLGVHVYAFCNPRPTPQLSLCIREIEAQSGMVITASHNPPQYNGLKIYGSDGAQLVSPYDTQVMEHVASAIPKEHSMSLELGEQQGIYTVLDSSYDAKFQDYIERVIKKVQSGDPLHTYLKPYSVVYTPLHGTGAFHIETYAKRFGINCIVEPSQKDPDGRFPTVEYPNPEDPKALTNAIETAKKTGASLVVANDPDADRVGIAECQEDGSFLYITGNQIGALLLYFILSRKEKSHTDKTMTQVFVNTIVTTTLQEKIARAYDVDVLSGYTGFKNIALFMSELENADDRSFVFACEESYGYLASDEVRDKDGISIAILCMHMAQKYHDEGLKLREVLETMYRTYGYHEERAISKNFLGKEGKEKIQNIMKKLRNTMPRYIGKERVTTVHDYLQSCVHSLDNEEFQKHDDISLPPSDVLVFTTERGNKICVRPSGTEPKIKFYLLYHTQPDNACEYETEKCALKVLLDNAEKEVYSWLEV